MRITTVNSFPKKQNSSREKVKFGDFRSLREQSDVIKLEKLLFQSPLTRS